jgi:hypothetical protein
MAGFTCLDMLRCSFFDFGTGWLIATMWPFDWIYPLLLWLPVFDCPSAFVLPWLGNGGGGGAPYAIDPCARACLNPIGSCNFKNIMQCLIRWFETLFPST